MCILGELTGTMAVAVGFSDMWQVTPDMWYVTRDMSKLICDTWHVVPDMSNRIFLVSVLLFAHVKIFSVSYKQTYLIVIRNMSYLSKALCSDSCYISVVLWLRIPKCDYYSDSDWEYLESMGVISIPRNMCFFPFVKLSIYLFTDGIYTLNNR